MIEVIETDFKQRAYDGKWERLGKIKDVDNAYEVFHGDQKIKVVPTRWITIGVYDYLMYIED